MKIPSQKKSESKRIHIKQMKSACIEIYDKKYSIISISYIPQEKGGFKTVLNCKCNKHKLCFKTTKSKFLNIGNDKNRISCELCAKENHALKFDIRHYQSMVNKNKGENVAILLEVKGDIFYMKCLRHEKMYNQIKTGLSKCGCKECLDETARANSTVTLSQIQKDIKKWGNSIFALSIIGNYNKALSVTRKVLYKCTKPGHSGDIIKSIGNRLYNHPCSKCSKEAKSLTYEQMIKTARSIHAVKYIYKLSSEIYTCKDSIEFSCPNCKKDNLMSFGSHIYKKRGCTFCIRK